MVEEREYLGPSLDPDDAIEGGLFDNKVVTFTNCRFMMYDYNGKFALTPCFMIDMVPDGDEDTRVEPYSAGNKDFWEPTEDGEWIKPLTKTELEIRKGSNLNQLLRSLKEAGLPMSLLKDRKISALNGLKALVVRKEISGRDDLQKDKPKTKRGADGREYAVDNKKLLVERIISLPGEGEAQTQKDPAPKKGGGKAKKEAADKKTAAAGAPPAGDSIAKKAKEFIVKQIVKGGGKVDKKELPNAAFVEMGQDPDRNLILPILFQNETIVSLGGLSVDDAGVITLAG